MAAYARTFDTSELEKDQLQGKHNFLVWRRTLTRAIIANDLQDIFDGTEKLENEPMEEDYLALKENESPTPQKPSHIDIQRSMYNYQAALTRWEKKKAKFSFAMYILLKSLSPIVTTEIETMRNPKDACAALMKIYGVSDEVARSQLMRKANELKRWHCDSMIEYINKHREIGHDIQRTGQVYDDSQIISNILSGLPASYEEFTRSWEFHRMAQGEHVPPNFQFLMSRLLTEDEARAKTKGKTDRLDKSGKFDGKKKMEKSNLVCKFPGCGKNGHEEKECWVKFPEKMPEGIKEKIRGKSEKWPKHGGKDKNRSNDKTDDKPIGIVAMIQNHVANGTTLCPPIEETRADCFQAKAESNEDGSMDLDDRDTGKVLDAVIRNNHKVMMAMGTKSGGHEFLLDSGADICVLNDKKWFEDIKLSNGRVHSVDQKHSMEIEGKGKATFVAITPEGDDLPITLTQALYCRDTKYNIISMSYLGKKANLSGSWNGDQITIDLGGKKVLSANEKNGLYFIPTKEREGGIPQKEGFVANLNLDDPVWMWHRRLGHLSLQGMVDLLGQSNGIPLTATQIRNQMNEICPICATAKALHSIPRDPAHRRQEELGGLIHVDMWGKYPIEAYDGTKYFLFATDDATRFTWCRPMSKKSSLADEFRSLHYYIQNTHNVVIRGYRFDGEFHLGPVGAWLKKKNIHMEPTVPYQHYMGGSQERANRTIREKAASMIQEINISGHLATLITSRSLDAMKECSLDDKIWPEAIKYGVWLKNRSPTRAIKEVKTPWELVYKQKPTFGRESVYGSRVWVTLPPEIGHMGKPKLHSPRGWVGYFVGMEAESIYRIYSPDKHLTFRVGIARVQQGKGLDDKQEGTTDKQHQQSEEQVEDETDILDDTSIEEAEEVCQEPDEEGHEFEWETQSEEGGSEHSPSEDEEEGSTSVREYEDDVNKNISEDTNDQDSETRREARDEIEKHQAHRVRKQLEGQHLSKVDFSTRLIAEKDDGIMDQTSHFFAAVMKNGDDDYEPSSGSDSESDSDTKVQLKAGTQTNQNKEIPNDSIWTNEDYTGLKHARPAESDENDSMNEQERKHRMINVGFQVENPCWACVTDGYTCRKDSEEDQKCNRCAMISRKCQKANMSHPDTIAKIRENKERRARNSQERKAKSGRKTQRHIGYRTIEEKVGAKKCWRCRKAKMYCDGRRPCGRCVKKNGFCIDEEVKENPKCRQCVGRHCDRKFPCSRCVEQKRNCSYTKQEGLLTELYPITKAALKMHGKSAGHKCYHCITKKKRCDGEQPCTTCVKNYKMDKVNCIYRKNDYLEKYSVGPYEIGLNGEPTLREDWETLLPRAINVKRGAKTAKKRKERNDTSLFTKGQIPHNKKNKNTGHMIIIPTPSDNLECGMHAIRLSIESQLPDLKPPTLEDLRRILMGETMRERNALVNLNNVNNLTVDQVAAILQIWGEQNGATLQLGLYLNNGERTTIFPIEDSTTIWIHNDQAAERNEATYNHFSGVNLTGSHKLSLRENDKESESEQEDRAHQGRTGLGKTEEVDDDVLHFEGHSQTQDPGTEDDTTKEKGNETDRSQIDGHIYMVSGKKAGSSSGKIIEKMTDEDIEYHRKEDYAIEHERLNGDIGAFRGEVCATISTDAKTLPPEPESYAEAMRSPESAQWKGARDAEIDSHKENGTFLEVDEAEVPPGATILKGKWVWARKLNHRGEIKKHKARLVAKGYLQKDGIDYEETFSAVIQSTGFRMIFAIAAFLGWRVYLMDAVTAFLNGEINLDLFMKPPVGWKVPKGKILKIIKSLYGLKQAPRVWYEKFWKTLQEWGFRKSEFDPCVFIHDEDKIILGVWVDDSIIAVPNEEVGKKIRTKLSAAFKMKDEGLCEHYLGMQVEQRENEIRISQKTYIEQMLQKYGLENMKEKKVPITPGGYLTKATDEASIDSLKVYQKKTGSVVYLAGKSRPDACFTANYLARYMSNPGSSHAESLDNLMGYFKHTKNMGYSYKRGSGKLEISGFTDADFGACLDTRRSTTGWIFMMAGGPISWSSQRQKTVALSTTDAEYVASSEAAKEAIWIRGFINDLNVEGIHIDTIPLYVDNESARKLTRNPELHNRTKYIDIRHHFIRERVLGTKEINTIRVNTKYNISDLLTKPMTKARLDELLKMIGMTIED